MTLRSRAKRRLRGEAGAPGGRLTCRVIPLLRGPPRAGRALMPFSIDSPRSGLILRVEVERVGLPSGGASVLAQEGCRRFRRAVRSRDEARPAVPACTFAGLDTHDRARGVAATSSPKFGDR
jgi:hypothetical protein